jgi:hypothetical protein
VDIELQGVGIIVNRGDADYKGKGDGGPSPPDKVLRLDHSPDSTFNYRFL